MKNNTSKNKKMFILTIIDYDDVTRYVMCGEKAKEVQEMLETYELNDEVDYSFEEIDHVDQSIFKHSIDSEDINISHVFNN